MPPHAFSEGRPSGQVFQVISTLAVQPRERYDFWVDTQLRDIRMERATARPDPDFRAQLLSLASASHEMHYAVSDALYGERPLADVRAHGAAEISLFYLLQGRYDGRIEDHAVHAEAGEFFLYDPTRPQTLRLSPHRLVQIDLPRRAVAALFNGQVPTPWLLNEALRKSPLTALLRSHLDHFPTLAPALSPPEQAALLRATESLALDILRGACLGQMNVADDQGSDALFLAVQHYIEDRLGEPRLDPGQIAAHLGCSRASLYRLFQRQGQEGVAAYIRERRLLRLRRLLEDPLDQRPLWTLAQTCGLYDPSNLGALFRKRFGVGPRDYRAQAASPPAPP